MKSNVKILLSCFLMSSFLSFAQTEEQIAVPQKTDSLTVKPIRKIKPFSMGVKIGVPNSVGGGVEYALPIFNRHLALYGDLSAFSLKVEDTELDISYREIGVNFYLNNQAKGLYLGAGFGRLDSNFVMFNIDLIGGNLGKGKANLLLNSTNLKLGVKTGGRIYFRAEMGYGFADVPSELVFTATSTAGFQEPVTEELPEIPGLSSSGFLIGNIGFGLSF